MRIKEKEVKFYKMSKRLYEGKSIDEVRELLRENKWNKQKASKYLGKELNGYKILEVWNKKKTGQRFIVKKGDRYITLSDVNIAAERWNKDEEDRRIKMILEKGKIMGKGPDLIWLRLKNVGQIRVCEIGEVYADIYGKNLKMYHIVDPELVIDKIMKMPRLREKVIKRKLER